MKRYLPFLLIISACSSSVEQPPADYSEEINAISTGLLPNMVIEGEPLETFTLEERMKEYNVPGISIAFLEDGKIKWTYTAGYLTTDSANKVDENTRFQAASISKPVAASGLLTLVEAGELSLDSSVNSYLTDWKIPENAFTAEKPITLRQLVTHTAGLTVHGFRGYAEGENVPTTQQVLQGAPPANSAEILPDTIPESIWRYSGGGYTVMQHVVENLHGSFPEFMKSAVLEPVGMTRSTYQQPLPVEERENVSIGHRPDGSQVEGKWHTYPEIAAAGLWTTPSDLAKWSLAVQRAYNGSTEEFISPATAKAMLTPNAHQWGLGPGVMGSGDSLRFSHGGANEGYRCYFMTFAKNGGQGIAIMTNGDLGSPLFSEIMRSASKHYGWNTHNQQVRSVISLPTEAKKEFEGVYTASDGFEITMEMKGDQLTGRYGGNEFILYPSAEDTFFDNQDGQTLRFQRDESGKLTGFEVQGMVLTKK
jgi:CubicO group peptidase (beta-lactamase class C family)